MNLLAAGGKPAAAAQRQVGRFFQLLHAHHVDKKVTRHAFAAGRHGELHVVDTNYFGSSRIAVMRPRKQKAVKKS
jgi:hypothetical protein